jgi:uncharacterized protein YjbJ (UPF0337 family)
MTARHGAGKRRDVIESGGWMWMRSRRRAGLDRFCGISIESGTTSRPGRFETFSNTGAIIMGSTADKASGLANEAVGRAKQGVGNVVGSDKLKTEGAAQELKGDAQKAAGDAKAAVKDAANKTADALNKKL